MTGYESGLSFETLQSMVDANAIDTLSDGTLTKDRGRWRGKLTYYVTVNGESKQKQVSHTFSDTKVSGRGATSETQARKMLAAWRAQVIKDARSIDIVTKDPTRPTIECVMTFIKSKEKTDEDGNMIGARHSTLTFYRSCAARISKDSKLASMALIDVRRADVQKWVDDLSKTLARKSVTDSLNILSQACADVLGDASNPCKGVKVPTNMKQTKRGIKSRPNALSVEGVARLNTLLDERVEKYDGIDMMTVGVRIALHTGMRAEEVSGLKWGCVDFDNHLIYVENVIERAVIDGKHVEFDSTPKTKGSIRSIPMDSELTRILTEHKQEISKVISTLERWSRPDIEELYVIGQINGDHYSPHRLGINFKKFCRSRNIIGTEGEVVGFHDLRHSFATLGISQHPERISEISATLGHAQLTTTMNIYVGKDESEQRAFVDSMADVFSARVPEDVTMLKNGTDE